MLSCATQGCVLEEAQVADEDGVDDYHWPSKLLRQAKSRDGDHSNYAEQHSAQHLARTENVAFGDLQERPH